MLRSASCPRPKTPSMASSSPFNTPRPSDREEEEEEDERKEEKEQGENGDGIVRLGLKMRGRRRVTK